MKKIIIAAAFTAVALLGGCATTGTNRDITDTNKIAMIKPGKSTKQDVEAIFGKPGSVQYLDKGEQVWSYQNVSTSALAFVPIVNMLGNSAKESTLFVRFNSKGVVKEFQQGETRL